MGKGVQIRPDTDIFAGHELIISDGCDIGTRNRIAGDVIIEKEVLMGPDNYLVTWDHCYTDINKPVIAQGAATISKNGHSEMRIGEGSWIGTHCAIIGCVHIGKHCVIGANTVVTKDIPDYCVAVGNPARIIKKYNIISGQWEIISKQYREFIDYTICNQFKWHEKGESMMEKDLITVVLPIYNVEKYLERCIRSVIEQTYKNIEIILVDDGSPDSCPELCEEWAKKDSRIKVVHKENAGLGMARNTGIENAHGKYICFFDSDDYIEKDTIELAVAAAKAEKADVVIWGFNNINRDGQCVKSTIPNTPKDCYKGNEVASLFLPALISEDLKTGESHNLIMSAWASMFSLDLIHKTGFRFVSERKIIAEDVYSLLGLYKRVTCVAVLDKALYNYCENEQSLTHAFRKDRFEKVKTFYIQSVDLAKELGYGSEIINRLSVPFYSFTVAALKMIVEADMDFKSKLNAIKAIVEDESLHNALSKIDFTNRNIFKRMIAHSIMHM